MLLDRIATGLILRACAVLKLTNTLEVQHTSSTLAHEVLLLFPSSVRVRVVYVVVLRSTSRSNKMERKTICTCVVKKKKEETIIIIVVVPRCIDHRSVRPKDRAVYVYALGFVPEIASLENRSEITRSLGSCSVRVLSAVRQRSRVHFSFFFSLPPVVGLHGLRSQLGKPIPKALETGPVRCGS